MHPAREGKSLMESRTISHCGMAGLDEAVGKKLLRAQKSEITEHIIYRKLAEAIKDDQNRQVLERISKDELKHHDFWKHHTGAEVCPSRFRTASYYLISRLLGITFGLRLMERGEDGAQNFYREIAEKVPGAEDVIKDEVRHEKELLDLIDEERLKYAGSMVLGLNDALVELTGALAGFTLALRNTSLIAMTGLITGIAAALSMAASEYLSTKAEETTKSAEKAALYTGGMYIAAVIVLVLPFIILRNAFISLGISIAFALVMILMFTFYISVAKELPFRRRFLEMALISLGVAAFSFGVGMVLRLFFSAEL
jgi:VIT1/CCC1 family predicted Fe2+/Mn2+ transporter